MQAWRELKDAETACGDYLKPGDTLVGAIRNMRQVADTATEVLKRDGRAVPSDEWLALRECYKAAREYTAKFARYGGAVGPMHSLGRLEASIQAVDKVMAA